MWQSDEHPVTPHRIAVGYVMAAEVIVAGAACGGECGIRQVVCGRCAPVCIYDAIGFTDGLCRIDPEKCDGCGLCVSVCRQGAISISPKTL